MSTRTMFIVAGIALLAVAVATRVPTIRAIVLPGPVAVAPVGAVTESISIDV